MMTLFEDGFLKNCVFTSIRFYDVSLIKNKKVSIRLDLLKKKKTYQKQKS
jgi:hypothetical protein